MKDRLRKNYVFRIIIDDVSKHAVDLPNLCHYNLGDILKKILESSFFPIQAGDNIGVLHLICSIDSIYISW